ncbi:MAG TPA: hypothetical protein VHJ59_01365 [Nitrososphaera sp.]|nr:hypothetical protein [Nitrososphaera sp.]
MKILDNITAMSWRVTKSMLSIMTAAGIAAREIIATINCSRLSAPLYFLIIKYVDKLPKPMPARIRYWYNDGKTAIAAKGPTQQIPLSAFAPAGHLALVFILQRIIGTTLRKWGELAPNTAPKLTSQIIA